jgi:hypothetical protein
MRSEMARTGELYLRPRGWIPMPLYAIGSVCRSGPYRPLFSRPMSM